MSETAETRLRRLHMRSIRRGIREMDLVLTAFAETRLRQLPEAELTLYEALLEEPDQDVLSWVTGQAEPPARYRPLVPLLRAAAEDHVRGLST